VPLHPPEANEDVLQRIIQSMAKVQRRRNIGRGDYNCVSFTIFAVGVRFGVKVLMRNPYLIRLPLYRLGFINFRKLLTHGFSDLDNCS